jgi:hypothetical protein
MAEKESRGADHPEDDTEDIGFGHGYVGRWGNVAGKAV